MYMLKDETFFESDLFRPRGRIAICPPPYRNAGSDAKIKPQPTDRRQVKILSQFPKFLNMICFILKLLKGKSLEE